VSVSQDERAQDLIRRNDGDNYSVILSA